MQQTRLVLASLVFVMLLCTGTATAEEVIYFSNGTSMPIRAHKIVGEMIHIDLGSDSSMAFPMSMVGRIEAAGKDVRLRAGSSVGNRMTSGNRMGSGGSRPVQGQGRSHYSKADNIQPDKPAADDPRTNTTASGMAIHRPQADSNSAGQLRFGSATAPTAAAGRLGSRRNGTRHVIGGGSPRNTRGGVQVIGVQLLPSGNDGGAEQPAGDRESSSSSGSGSGN